MSYKWTSRLCWVVFGAWFAFCAGVPLFIIGATLAGCAQPPQKDVRNRVPTMPVDNTCKPVQDGCVQCADNKIYCPPKPESQTSDKGEKLERTRFGTILSVGEEFNNIDAYSKGWYLSFIFRDETGYEKKFFPVCDGETLPTNHPIALTYHWQGWKSTPTADDHNTVGCYYIDGYQTR
jgi:hypothetical protein